ncbi:MAG: hypothetical protein NZ908_01325 [Candidatus Micrarchaeota archaeon]|nr:hypothetical protein [Candidatus Micrarchaeota archaeon]MCX8154362.1 hypothetical protein [Candidatus Micrarchaeota archaeon]
MNRQVFSDLENMLNDFEIRKMIVNEIGDNALSVIRYFISSPDTTISEEDLCRILNISGKELREVMNILHDHKISMYYKRENLPNHFTFYWKVDLDELRDWIYKNSYGRIEDIMNRIESGEELYYCDRCSERFNIKLYSFEEAVDLNFKCEHCTNVLEPLTNEIVVKYR